MLAYRQPSFKECVIAHWSSDSAPKMIGTKSVTETTGAQFIERGRKALCTGLKLSGNDGWTVHK